MNKCYTLSSGTQVREEDFGLLFYTMRGPRLYFLGSGGLLKEDFFFGKISLADWLAHNAGAVSTNDQQANSLAGALKKLQEKGVLIEC